ncbi:MAG TPA: hypothetical protein VEK56_17100 [Vicinamibacterales bacterium]|nr:hypothetical protein [Vicinamibacterales bacterium]
MTRKILIVAQTTPLASTLVTWLGEVRHDLVLATTYPSAKLHLSTRPDLLITELKLGEYNGLQLALRAQTAGVPTIILGVPDTYFEREAERFGATYVDPDLLECEELHALIAKLLDAEHVTETATLPWSVPDALLSGSRPFVLH